MHKLIKEAYQIKTKVAQMQSRLKEINLQVAEQAEYKEGSKTGHIYTPDFEVTVSLRENVKWNQERLSEISRHIPEFNKLVKTEIKPDVRKIKKLENNHQKAFDWCKEVKPAAPSVTYSLVEAA